MAFNNKSKPKRKGSKQKSDVMRRGIFILPSMITTMGLFFGFFSIIRSIRGDFEVAAWAILIAAVFDFLDGAVARITHTSTKFGIEYDSLCDLVSFGMAPGLLVYSWALQPFGRFGWLATFLFFACATLRLARFNVQAVDVEKNTFQGLPTPASAGLIACWVLFHHYHGFDDDTKHLSVVLAVYALAFLMVSGFRYRNMKQFSLKNRHPFSYLVLAVLILIFVASEPQSFLFPLACLYVLHAPVESLYQFIRRRFYPAAAKPVMFHPVEHKEIHPQEPGPPVH